MIWLCYRYVLRHWPKLVINFGLAGRLSHHLTLIGNTFSSISCWIVVSLTIDRLILTRLPFRAKDLSTPKRAYLALAITVLLCCAVNAVRMYEFFEVPIVVFPCNGYWKIPTEVVNSDGSIYIPIRYRKAYWIYAIASTVLFMYVAPAIIMLVCNIIIIFVFKKKKVHTASDNSNTIKKKKAERRLTKMILVVSMIFMICNIPDIATRLMWKFLDPLIVSNVQPVAHLFLMVNVGANFVVYSLLNKHLFDTILGIAKKYCRCHQPEEGNPMERLPTGTSSTEQTPWQ